MKIKRSFCKMLMMLMLCLVLAGTMAACAVPARAAGTWGSASYDGLFHIDGWLAGLASGAVKLAASLLSALGFWAAIGGIIWYGIVRRGDYSTKTRWYALATLLIGVIAFLVGTGMLVLDAPGRAYLAVLLHLLR